MTQNVKQYGNDGLDVDLQFFYELLSDENGDSDFDEDISFVQATAAQRFNEDRKFEHNIEENGVLEWDNQIYGLIQWLMIVNLL